MIARRLVGYDLLCALRVDVGSLPMAGSSDCGGGSTCGVALAPCARQSAVRRVSHRDVPDGSLPSGHVLCFALSGCRARRAGTGTRRCERSLSTGPHTFGLGYSPSRRSFEHSGRGCRSTRPKPSGTGRVASILDAPALDIYHDKLFSRCGHDVGGDWLSGSMEDDVCVGNRCWSKSPIC